MVKKELLSEMKNINIIGGQITSRVEVKNPEDESKSVQVLVPKAISNGTVNHDDLNTINAKIDLDEKKLTKKGDIVLKLSAPYDACLITEEDEGLLVPSFCAIINQIPEEFDSNYLIAYLNSDVCRERLRGFAVGAVIPLLSVGALKKLEVPVPDMKIQKRIGEEYMLSLEKMRIVKRILSLEQERLNSEFYEMEDR